MTEEKREVEVARDGFNRDLIRTKAELSSKIETLTDQIKHVEQERDLWKERFAEIEKEIQCVKEITEEKVQDMAVAVVVAHDFQVHSYSASLSLSLFLWSTL